MHFPRLAVSPRQGRLYVVALLTISATLETAWLAHAQSTPAAPSVSVVTPAPSASPAPAPPPLSPTEAWIKKSKEPFAWWKWSADLRIRDEFQNNASSLTNDHAVAPRHKQNYQRLRLRFGNVFTPIKDVDLNLRLTIESRNWMKDTASPPIHKGWDWNEVVFEYAHIRLKNLGGSPITITAGRQDLQFGEGFLIFEGTPLDGSRTMYFDALRATCEIKSRRTTIDAIVIDQYGRNDHYLPPIKIAADTAMVGDARVTIPIKKMVIEQNERGAILYVTNKQRAGTEINGYYIYKQAFREPLRVARPEDAGTYAPFEVSTTPDDPYVVAPQIMRGEDAKLHTFGSRVVGEITPTWQYRAEAAFQVGRKNGRDLTARGFNGALMFVPRSKHAHQLRLSYEYLSGDKAGSADKDEQFDVLWGRFPRWSELYIYTYVPEMRLAQMSNLHRLGPGWTFRPWKNTEYISDFYLLLASQNNRSTALFAPSGKMRGQLLTTVLKQKFSAHLSGHVWGEYFFPGSYYAADRRMTATFGRAELFFAW